jgi:hypothetical protein
VARHNLGQKFKSYPPLRLTNKGDAREEGGGFYAESPSGNPGTRLYLAFASLNPDDSLQVKTFAESYGLLGLAVHHAWAAASRSGAREFDWKSAA